MESERLKRLMLNSCTHPIKRKYLDPLTKLMVTKECACGKCYHCKMTKQNEWVTRMTLQTNTWKYAYFITLTYDSKTCPSELLADCHATTSYCNSFHREERNAPLTLCKRHLQTFWKRLRKALANIPISYYECGEYGSTYCRPHYHIICWCDEPITKQQIEDAWTLNDCKIGEIDFNDIKKRAVVTENGKSFNPYKYVTKYVTKGFEVDFRTMPNAALHYELINKIDLKNYESIRKEGETDQELRYRVYFEKNRPFALSSKQHVIGGRYFEANVERFATGDFRLFGVSQKDLVYPAYFYRRTRDYVCPIRTVMERTVGDFTLSCTPNYVPSVSTFVNRVAYAQKFSADSFEGNENPLKFIRRQELYGVLNFYDKSEKSFYLWNRDRYNIYNYDKHLRKWKLTATKTKENVLDRLSMLWEKLLTFLGSFRTKQLMREAEKNELLMREYLDDYMAYVPESDEWYEALEYCKAKLREELAEYEETFNAVHQQHQMKYKLTKNKF